MDLFWLNLLTRSSTTESPLLLCGLKSVVWMQSLLAGKDNGRSTTKRRRATMNGVEVEVALLLLLRFLPHLFVCSCVLVRLVAVVAGTTAHLC